MIDMTSTGIFMNIMKDKQSKNLTGSQRIRISILEYSESSGNELSFDVQILEISNFQNS